MSDMVIRVEHVGKQFRLGNSPTTSSLRESLTNALGRLITHHATRDRPAAEQGEFWALNDVSFTVGRGEALGIIGNNGAGKSTLLKILSRITEPTSGRIELMGRVASLLEVGTGFHPDLSGRENVFMNGALLGLSRSEIRLLFDEIVRFAGVEKFIDTPVKRYSSGMRVRLGFAVAAHLRSEILIVDEVLAVGDAEFQGRCLSKMNTVAHGGRTVLFVSHNMTAMRHLCPNCLWLRDGRIAFLGPTGEAIDRYLGGVTVASPRQVDLRDHPGRSCGMRPILTSLRFSTSRESCLCILSTGDDVVLDIDFDTVERLGYAILAVSTVEGERVLTVGTHHDPKFSESWVGRGSLRCVVPGLALAPGVYSAIVAVGTSNPYQNVDEVSGAFTFEVTASDIFGTGAVLLPGQGHFAQRSRWTLDLRP